MCHMQHLTPTQRKRLEQYPDHVRKIKRLRKQIRDLNRCIRKLKTEVREDTLEDVIEMVRQIETKVMQEIDEATRLPFARPRGTFLS